MGVGVALAEQPAAPANRIQMSNKKERLRFMVMFLFGYLTFK
jgi:hypothetical protein